MGDEEKEEMEFEDVSEEELEKFNKLTKVERDDW